MSRAPFFKSSPPVKDLIDAKEIWNVLNAQKQALLDEVGFIENLMGLIEKRQGAPASHKIFYQDAPAHIPKVNSL